MKVKVGNKIYDGEREPVMVILTEADKKNIANMRPDATKYCQFPDEVCANSVSKWMDQVPKPRRKIIGGDPHVYTGKLKQK